MNQEIWKPVRGYKELYEVSSRGRVRTIRPRGTCNGGSLPRNREGILSDARSTDGYRLVVLYSSDGKRRMHRVHVLVLEEFLGPRPTRMMAGHLNAVRDDNRVENLRWLTNCENVSQRTKDGNTASGEGHGRAKLTEIQVQEIRSLRGAVTQKDLAHRFGVSKTSICFIQSGRNWPHVKQ